MQGPIKRGMKMVLMMMMLVMKTLKAGQRKFPPHQVDRSAMSAMMMKEMMTMMMVMTMLVMVRMMMVLMMLEGFSINLVKHDNL